MCSVGRSKENKNFLVTKYEYYMGTPHGLCARVTEVRICLEIDIRTDRHSRSRAAAVFLVRCGRQLCVVYAAERKSEVDKEIRTSDVNSAPSVC